MVEARLRVELPDGQWKANVSRAYPDISFQILSTVMCGGRAVETVVFSGCDTDGCLSTLDLQPDICNCTVVEQSGNRTTVRLETADPTILSATVKAGAPLVYPVDLKAAELRATFVGTHAALSSLGNQLRTNGVDVDVAYIQSDHDVGQILTDRQAEVLFTAVDHGYYRSPRNCTLTEVAERLDIAKSTCSETLQRAEEAVIEYFCVRQQPPGQETPERQDAVVGHSGE